VHIDPTWAVLIGNGKVRHALALVDETDVVVEEHAQGAISVRRCDETDGLRAITRNVLDAADAWLADAHARFGVMDATFALYEVLESSSIAGGWKIGIEPRSAGGEILPAETLKSA
jgi:hypothetical protein